MEHHEDRSESSSGTASEARRLEALWSGSFGDEYVERNLGAATPRSEFWRARLAGRDVTSALEVGCNVGGNLVHLAAHLEAKHVHGIDVNEGALARLRTERPDLNLVWSPARSLPYRDRLFDLTFTVGVLIHQPDSTLPLVMGEIVRCSRRYVLSAEYHAEEQVEVPYRGERGALFKRDYGRLYGDLFPELRLVDEGFSGHDEGFDDITWHLFERDQP